tara:strand:+ start:238 stop:369 length:132 start_codon:yes stop_codon:yes gene_type:complete
MSNQYKNSEDFMGIENLNCISKKDSSSSDPAVLQKQSSSEIID